MKYIFSEESNKLKISLDTQMGLYQANVYYFNNPSVGLSNNTIKLLENGKEVKEFQFDEITTINGIVPINISDAFAKMYSFLVSINMATIPYKLISLATTNANVVKASPGNLRSIIAIGLSSTVRYLKLYNKATIPLVGVDIPVMTIPIPANTQGAGIAIPFAIGVKFNLGISLAITATALDNGNTPVAAGDVIINLTYA
jgi:hypothetical protein